MKEYYDEMMILREENGRFKAVNLEQKKEIIVLKEREDFAKEKLRRQKKKNEDLKRHMKEVNKNQNFKIFFIGNRSREKLGKYPMKTRHLCLGWVRKALENS